MFGSKNGVLWEMCKWRMNFCASANLTCGGGRGGGVQTPLFGLNGYVSLNRVYIFQGAESPENQIS